MATPEPAKPFPSATQILRGAQEFGFEADFADLAARFAAKSGGGLSAELSAELALEIVLNEIVEQACQITGATGAAIVLDRDGELLCRASSGSTAPELGSRIERSAGLIGESVRTHKTLWCDDTYTDPRAEAEASRQSGVRSLVVMPLLRVDTLVGIIELSSTQPYAFGVRDERALEVLADRTLTNLDHASQPTEPLGDSFGPAADLQEEDLQKIGLQDVNLQNIALQSLGLPVNGAGNANVAELPAAKFPPPELSSQSQTKPNPSPAKPEVSSNQKNADASVASGVESDFDFPEFDPAEITPVGVHSLLENAGVIAPETPAPAKQPVPERRPEKRSEAAPVTTAPAPIAASSAAPKQVDYVSWALGFAVLSVAVLLGLVLGQHFVLSHSHGPIRAASVATRPPVPSQTAPTPQTPAVAKPASDRSEAVAKTSRPAHIPGSRDGSASSDETVPPGGLLVFQNGKEVFRLSPGPSQTLPAEIDKSAQQVVQPASDLGADSPPQPVVDLPEASAQRELLHRVEPDYPEAARDQNIQGPVVLEVHIGTNGSVENVEVLSGAPLLAQASTDAVKQWRFKPRVINGHPVEMQTRVTFDFKLPQ